MSDGIDEPSAGFAVGNTDIPELLGEIYEAASATERISLLERLISPLGLMAAFGVAGGVFARVWFQRDFQDSRILVEDTFAVGKDDVRALTSFVEQVSLETIDSIGQLVASSPALAATAAAALLLGTLGRRFSRGRAPS